MATTRYRWAILAVFALLNAVLQIHWLALAPITREAAAFYHVTSLSIAMQSMMFMLVYIVVSLPASYVIDTYGSRVGVSVGAILIGVFGMLKGLYATNYSVVTISQIGLAIAQPFVINATTRISAEWFPYRERATATGIAILSQYVGIVVAMAVTPPLVHARNIDGMLMLYGYVALVAACVFIPLFKSHPGELTQEEKERVNVSAGLRHIFHQRQMLMVLLLFFIGLGIFNAVTTWIEEILGPRGFNANQTGIAGAIMIVGGIIGASVLPPLSDRAGKRVPFLIVTSALAVPGLAGLTFASSYPLLLASSFLLGFASMSAGPIGFQYGAELSHPAPESTSQGLIMVSGQISGAIFIYAMQAFRSDGGSMTPIMVFFIAATAFNAFLCTRMSEPVHVHKSNGK